MNNKCTIIVILAALGLVGAWLGWGVWADKKEAQPEVNSSAAGTQLAGTPTSLVDFSGNPLVGGDAVPGQFADDGLFSISVIYSAEYGFSPETIEVQQGRRGNF